MELQALSEDAGRLGGSRRRLLLRRPAGFDFHSVREYAQGESLRRVHWPTTARRGQLMVKELEDTPRDTVVVLLDSDPAGACGDPPNSSFDEAVRAAGSVLKVYASRGRKASLLTTGTEGGAQVSSLPGDFGAVLGVLAAAEANARSTLPRWLANEHARTAQAGELVVVTANLEPVAVDALVAVASRRLLSVVWIDSPSYVGRPTRAASGPPLFARNSRRSRPSRQRSGSCSRRASSGCNRACLISGSGRSPPAPCPRSPCRLRGFASSSRARSDKRPLSWRWHRPGAGGGTEAAGARRGRRGASRRGQLSVRSPGSSSRTATSRSSSRSSTRSAGALLISIASSCHSPDGTPEMHALVLTAIFGFVLAVALLAASARPVAAAAVTVAGAGWPATLLGDEQTVAMGALASAAALSTPLILRVRSSGSLVAGIAASVLVGGRRLGVFGDFVAREAAVNWQSWDFSGIPVEATGVRFAWDSNYDGIEFPATKTVVLTVEGPERARYWRTSTLDLFASDHWFEDLLWLSRVDDESDAISLDRLAPPRAALEENWLEQRVEVRALVDDRLAAAGTPVALDSRRLGTVFRLSGGVPACSPLSEGQSYRVWSYAPDPSPAVLASSKPQYPTAARRYLVVDGRLFPGFADPGRENGVRELFSSPARDSPTATRSASTCIFRCNRSFVGYASLYRRASDRRVSRQSLCSGARPRVVVQAPRRLRLRRAAAARGRRAARRLRDEDESRVLPALRGRDGADAAHARDPRSGRGRLHERAARRRKWIVTDHEAHAWVEVWFAGQGWVPFDPTLGEGRSAASTRSRPTRRTRSPHSVAVT